MNFATKIDYSVYCEEAARKLWGDPTQSNAKELRWGTHGSRSLNREHGRWYDHETNEGGSTIELLTRELGHDFTEATAWLRKEFANGSERSLHGSGKPCSFGSIVATYDYTDESGALLFQVVRFEPKTFRQRRPDGHGSWAWSVKGVRPLLYRLPELIEAVAQGKPVFVCEGEKDADNLAKLGIPATTNAMGVGKWRSEYNETLRGADVIIIPDNDEAGRDHAKQVAAALAGIATRIRVLDIARTWPECPPKGDISDWIASGGTADRLEAMVEALPDTASPTIDTASRVDTWPVMDDAAYHGLAGEVVHTIGPHSEADPVAILLQFLTCAGNAIGRTAYYQVESDRHHANLFAVLVGASAKARKGTSAGRISAIMKIADERWADDRTKGGLSTGEGLINEVRDEVKKWDGKAKQFETVDPGVIDKRLMVVEAEFAGALTVMERHGNNLSPVIRKAWDGGKLTTMTRHSPLCATGSHISIVGHITTEEVRARLSRTDMANGFANRFLFALIKRSKGLPFGGELTESQILHLGEPLKVAIEAAKGLGRITWTADAAREWAKVYGALSADRPGLLGAITARAEAQVVRLAMIYAALDGKGEIDLPHLKAALAIWEFCEASAAHIFGSALGDPIADEILRALQQAREAGMTRTAIRDLFGRHQSADRIGAALALLTTRGRGRFEARETGGRPVEVWFSSAEPRHG